MILIVIRMLFLKAIFQEMGITTRNIQEQMPQRLETEAKTEESEREIYP